MLDIIDVINDINTNEIDCSSYVLESLILYYDKFDKCQSSPEIFQESSSPEKRGFFSSIGHAIVNFFKSIVDGIKNFFNKIFGKNKKNKKNDNVDRLNEIDKIDQKEADKIQDTVDNNTKDSSSQTSGSDISKQVDDVTKEADKHVDLGDQIIDNSVSSGETKKERKKREKREKHTKVNVKKKKIYTRIIFSNWIKFIDQCNEYFEETTSECTKINAAYDRPTRYLKKTTHKELYIKKDPKSLPRPTKKVSRVNGKKYDLFSKSIQSYKINEVTSNIKTIQDKLYKLQEVCQNSISKYEELDEYLKNNDENYNSDAIAYLKQTFFEYTELSRVIWNLIRYLQSELILYGRYCDLFDSAKEYNLKHKTQDVDTTNEDNDSKKDSEDVKDDNETEEAVSEYASNWYSRY